MTIDGTKIDAITDENTVGCQLTQDQRFESDCYLDRNKFDGSCLVVEPVIIPVIIPPYITPKIWMKFDDFCACFTSVAFLNDGMSGIDRIFDVQINYGISQSSRLPIRAETYRSEGKLTQKLLDRSIETHLILF